MIRLPTATAVAAFAALALAPSASHADVEVVRTTEEGSATVVSFATAKCKKATRKRALLKFIATANRGAYELRVNVYRLRNRMNLRYGGDGPADLTVEGPEGVFSNASGKPPDAPPGGGSIVFNAKRTRMGIGFAPMFTQDLNDSVSVAGGLKCKYPKKKRGRRR